MDLQVIESPLKVIGFNAVFNSIDTALQDIDQVETCLYRGEAVNSEITKPFTKNEAFTAYKNCIDLVLTANNLLLPQVVVVFITEHDDVEQADRLNEFANTLDVEQLQVKSLSEALLITQQLSTDQPVLIFSASLVNVDLATKQQSSTMSFDRAFEAYTSLEGVACILLCSEHYADTNNCVLYASIDKVCTGDHQQIDSVINSALAGIDVTHINTLEVTASAQADLISLEQAALLKAYSNQKQLQTAISCQKSVLGENGCLSQLLSLIHSVISLQQRYRPAIKDWSAPQESLLTSWHDSAFYLFNQAAPVFPSANGDKRLNSLSVLTKEHVSHLLISEVNDGVVHQNGFNRCSKQSLFILGANDQASLLTQLNELENNLSQSTDLKALATQCYQQNKLQNLTYKLVLIAESFDELAKEIKLSQRGINIAFENKSDWKTPKGSYFTSVPESNAKTAFLYPGIGATYVGLGRDLFHLFPEIYPSVVGLADNIGASLKDELLNPRSVVSLNFKDLKTLDLALRNSLANIAECGVGYACVFTKIFEQVFKLNADYASGYSMGEVSMFAALGCWQNPGQMSARLANSDTFNHQLSSELRAIRKLWNLPDIKNGEFEQIWETYSIKGTVEQVKAEIIEGERVYVTIVNTPDSLVIGGFPQDCLKVIKRLGVRAMPLNMANAIHSEPAYQEYEHMLELYNMPVTPRIDTKMISSSCYLPIPQLQKAIAVSIAKCLCEPVDFPRLINSLADKGSKVFVEMGAGRSLCSWADKTLKNSDYENHISVPVNAKGTDDQLTYARAAAKLVSFGVGINLESFFSGSLLVQVK